MSTKVITVKAKNVNSQLLYNKINTAVQEMIHYVIDDISFHELSDGYAMSDVTDYINMFMRDEVYQPGKIRQYDIICDHRNNSLEQVRYNKELSILIKYKQSHCLNWTELQYVVSSK